MVDILENAVVRIDIGINYSSLNDKEIELLDKILAMGDLQFNAPCNNRLARIAELKREARLLNQNETNKQTEITNKVLEIARCNRPRQGTRELSGLWNPKTPYCTRSYRQ